MGLACWVLHGHFGPVQLPQVSKNDDEKVASGNDLALALWIGREGAWNILFTIIRPSDIF